MTSTTLDYSSWLFQLIGVLVIVYLAVGLSRPSLVGAAKRSTVAIIAAVLLLIASTAFYLVASKLPGGDETAAEINVAPPQTTPAEQ
ncbi:MAG: hypothetical protein ACK4TP_03710 [Hyphomicrobium sp.]|jgi:hypothetical protein